MGRSEREYALYDGDKFIDVGTMSELEKRQGISKSTIKTWLTSKWQDANPNGKLAIKLEQDEE